VQVHITQAPPPPPTHLEAIARQNLVEQLDGLDRGRRVNHEHRWMQPGEHREAAWGQGARTEARASEPTGAAGGYLRTGGGRQGTSEDPIK